MSKPPKFPTYNRGHGNVFDWIMETAATVREERRIDRDARARPAYTAATRGLPTQILVSAHLATPLTPPPVRSVFHVADHEPEHTQQADESNPQSIIITIYFHT